MSEYLSSFNDIFKTVIDHFDFKVKSVGDDTIILIGNGYQLEFTMWRETVEFRFCVVKSNTEVLIYDVGNFIVTYMTNEDRVIDDIIIPKERSTVYIRNVKSLNYFLNALKHHFPSMFAGQMNWLDSYEKSEWYSQPRIEKRKV
ncbi:conserved hypothetical protein [Pectobacterium atrosepticum SCRI1043]|uniref:Uncharacterized protein n=1 Tax=Pectobacterium atrosepticum (strain SCRI 1043 / ATCC BAA-672) TaxID=218491 RepID=Q6D5B3_PECAS|nr:hypothetical protein [Pectobacterium atrosepticum]MCL6315860.1 hypothetical protein [Pectobacterium atrosepticum]MCL6319904.1 hypothetical protein [Pectobacterium atrosepticum]CAG75029.1 conserved hypothetical protein [Pectobacterium atrosepticum SCRI1043]